MAKPFDDLVKRTTTKQTRRRASRRTRELIATTAEERAAAGTEMDKIRANVRDKLTLEEIISSKLEGHRR
jgi:hypothetical protein